MVKETIYVKFFGRFTLSRSCGGVSGPCVAQEKSSQRLWTFLQYLCAYHEKGVSQEEVIEAIWGDAEIADPVGALKTILHRARQVLEELGFPDGKEVLLYRRGHYLWSPDVTLRLDTEELDRLCIAFANAPEETLPAALEFLSQCGGDLLPNEAGSFWVLSLRTFYHTRFLQLSYETAKLLQGLGRSDEAIVVCRTATELDPYDENCQLLLIRLLYLTGSAQAALTHYSTICELYMDRLGTAPSLEMRALYQEISAAGGGSHLELDEIRDQLVEKGAVKGPFFCEYMVFQDICRLVARSMQRTGEEAQLVLLTITENSSLLPEDVKRTEAMDALRTTGLSMLRPGDVAARLGPDQMLLLLPTTSRTEAQAALSRILSAFGHTPIGRSVRVETSLRPVLPSVGGRHARRGG